MAVVVSGGPKGGGLAQGILAILQRVNAAAIAAGRADAKGGKRPVKGGCGVCPGTVAAGGRR